MLGDRAFPVAAVHAWNSLSPAVRDAPPITSAFWEPPEDMVFWTN